jgi:hypothetical protein
MVARPNRMRATPSPQGTDPPATIGDSLSPVNTMRVRAYELAGPGESGSMTIASIAPNRLWSRIRWPSGQQQMTFQVADLLRSHRPASVPR